jgi:hypothetical protein
MPQPQAAHPRVLTTTPTSAAQPSPPFFAHHPHLTASCSSAQLQHTRFLQAPALFTNYLRWCGCLLAPTSRQIFAPCSCLPTTTSPSPQRLNCLLFPSSAPSCPLSLLYCL